MNLLSRASLRVVQVDDDPLYTAAMGVYLRVHGFAEPVRRFDRALAALYYLAQVKPAEAPHAVLLDLEMPEMSGLELLRWLRQDYGDPNLAIYMLTSSDDPAHRQEALRLGVTDYISKRGSNRRLESHLEQLIDLRNAVERAEAQGSAHDPAAELALLGLSNDNMVILTDAQGRVTWVNQSFTHTCGYTLEEMRGRKPGRVLQGPASDPVAVRQLHDAVHSARAYECELINYRKNGDAYPTHISLGPVFHDQALEGFLAVVHEIGAKQP